MSSKTASARPGHHRTSFYDEVTAKIIAELVAGRVPWVQPSGPPPAAGRGFAVMHFIR